MRRAKIVATLGPRSWSTEGVAGLLDAGADVFRLNLAHATRTDHAAAVRTVRDEADRRGTHVGLLADLPGPKMRTGPVKNGEVVLEEGATFVLDCEEREGDASGVSTTMSDLADIASPGDEVFLADGAIVLRVKEVARCEVVTEVVRRGILRSRKGMHLPRAERRVEAFTDDDRDALGFAAGLGVDLVGLSFVRDAHDVRRARDALPGDGTHPLLVAKIETRSAVENLASVIDAADAVMVARGDLGIQMPMQEVPILQKEIIRACNEAGKPVITATQMLESMTRSPLPTRAEVGDVANAVIDGSDALMLSEETAVGDHATDTVRTMADIITAAESAPREPHVEPLRSQMHTDRVSWAVAHAAVAAAEDLGVAAILCPTRSGATPFRVSAFRPTMPIVGLSEAAETLGSLALLWGVTPLAMPPAADVLRAESDVARAAALARAAGIVDPGALVVVAAGTPGHRAGRTDYVRVVRVEPGR